MSSTAIRIFRGHSLLVAISLLAFPGAARCTSIDLGGASFKSGRPVKGESLKSAVSDEFDIDRLKQSVEILRQHPILQFEVIGHTDPHECSGKECNELALRRAVLVYRYLLDAGVDARRVISLSEYASERPIADGDDYKRNQRAEVNFALEP